ncbi:glutathione peroxidase [Kozakia baliensis]|uniref:glutathione peroxidase n=1 Tax=Kozakia baliensis TaxID=153496 RepID=UPI0004954A92|nr:glutathione peroxidase [Kozakia baliensis]AOX19329.1 glutathione peroxidase [Kozakia baliensis]
MPTEFYDLHLPALNGSTINLNDYRGKPILIANTASKCGFTPQYEGLQHIWSQFRNAGLAVIGVPSNDFGQQEPGSAKEIEQFCHRNYGVGFPMAAKAHVRGSDAIPLFRWLAREGGFLSLPRWNFYKYLIDRDGKLAAWFTPITKPDSAKVENAVRRVLLNY